MWLNYLLFIQIWTRLREVIYYLTKLVLVWKKVVENISISEKLIPICIIALQ